MLRENLQMRLALQSSSGKLPLQGQGSARKALQVALGPRSQRNVGTAASPMNSASLVQLRFSLRPSADQQQGLGLHLPPAGSQGPPPAPAMVAGSRDEDRPARGDVPKTNGAQLQPPTRAAPGPAQVAFAELDKMLGPGAAAQAAAPRQAVEVSGGSAARRPAASQQLAHSTSRALRKGNSKMMSLRDRMLNVNMGGRAQAAAGPLAAAAHGAAPDRRGWQAGSGGGGGPLRGESVRRSIRHRGFLSRNARSVAADQPALSGEQPQVSCAYAPAPALGHS